MSELHKLIKLYLFLLAALLLPACALSPQTIQISPDLTPGGTTAAAGTALALDVRDVRSSPVLGYRGGVYATAAVSTGANVAAAVRTELSRVLTGLGVSVVPKGAPAAASLDIELQQLHYSATQNKILWKVKVSAVINARIDAAGRTESNSFENQMSKEFATVPTMFDNEKLINQMVSSLLQRIIEDDSVKKLLNTGHL